MELKTEEVLAPESCFSRDLQMATVSMSRFHFYSALIVVSRGLGCRIPEFVSGSLAEAISRRKVIDMKQPVSLFQGHAAQIITMIQAH